MLRSQQLSLRDSEISQRLNELSRLDEVSDEQRAEMDRLMDESRTVKTQFRAAATAEATEAETRSDASGEGAEHRALVRDVRLGRYLAAAVESRAVDGRESELNAASGLGAAGVMPWAALDPGEPAEARADAATSAPAMGRPTMQDAILARVFARSATAFLRVDTPSVPVGAASYPVFTTGAEGGFVAKGVAQDAEAATFEATILAPHRVSARYLWRVEDAAVLAGMEPALRDDLGMAMTDRIDRQIINGDGAGANLSGFLDSAGGPLTEPANPGAASTYLTYVQALRAQVDGIYAESEGAIRVLVGADWYQHAGGLYRNDYNEENVNDYYRSRAEGYRVSGHMPAAGSTARKIVFGIAARGMARAAVAPVWEGIRLIRDEISGAAKGEVALTAISLVSFGVLRKAQYAWIKAATA